MCLKKIRSVFHAGLKLSQNSIESHRVFWLLPVPLCVSVLKLEINQHDSFIMQSAAILHNVQISPSLMAPLMHVSGVTIFSTAAEHLDCFSHLDAGPLLGVTAPCFLGFGGFWVIS